MTTRIVKVYVESFPNLRFIGHCYRNADMIDGSFSFAWQNSFKTGFFKQLEDYGYVPPIENGYLGFMRADMRDFEGTFEYWIGMFFLENTPVPHGLEFFDLPANDVAIAWIQGKEGPELFQMHDEVMAKFEKEGLLHLKKDDKELSMFFERYQCPRYTSKNEK